MERVPQQLRPFVLLAPGAVLLITLYWFDYPNPDAGAAYPAHAWSTAGAVAGWWLELAALALIGRTQMIGWLALFSALAIGSVNGDNATLLTSAALPYVGLFGASLVLLFASSGAVLSAYGRRGRIAWSIAFASIGIAIIVFNSIFPSNPIWDGPVGVWAASLVAAPVFIWVRSLKVNYVDAPTESKGAPGPTVGETQIPPSSSVAPQGEAVQWPESSGSLFKGGVFGEEASSRGSVETMANTAGELTSSDRFRFGPPKQRWLAGCPFWGWFWLITVLWAITIAAQPFSAPAQRSSARGSSCGLNCGWTALVANGSKLTPERSPCKSAPRITPRPTRIYPKPKPFTDERLKWRSPASAPS